ncbi:Uncharacterised protein [Enterobacter cloacae]|nr:Uncharacterised protein [Enterobacter cloacae]
MPAHTVSYRQQAKLWKMCFSPGGYTSDVLVDPVRHRNAVSTDQPGFREAGAAIIVCEDVESSVKKIFCESLIKPLYNRRCRMKEHYRFGIASFPNCGCQKSTFIDGYYD